MDDFIVLFIAAIVLFIFCTISLAMNFYLLYELQKMCNNYEDKRLSMLYYKKLAKYWRKIAFSDFEKG